LSSLSLSTSWTLPAGRPAVRAPLRVGILCAGLAVFCGAGIVQVGQVRFADLWILTILLLLIGTVPPFVELWRGTFDPLSLRNIFVFVYLLEYGFRSVYVLLIGEIYYLGSVAAAHDLLRRTLLYASVNLICFYLGYAFFGANEMRLLCAVVRPGFKGGAD
jgi:hypothetical protein